jgi:hypothetical protein
LGAPTPQTLGDVSYRWSLHSFVHYAPRCSVQTFAANLRRLSVHGIESAPSRVVKTQTGPRLNSGQFNEENNRVSTDQLHLWLQ